MKEERRADLRVRVDVGEVSRVGNDMLAGVLGLIEVRRTVGSGKEGSKERFGG